MTNNQTMTSQQLAFLEDDVFLPAKMDITQKLTDLLNQTGKAIQKKGKADSWMLPFRSQRMKVSRGENYLSLPYLIVDYPALFSKEDVFACRTMCWWGRFFSFTLHLQGQSLYMYRQAIVDCYSLLHHSQQEWYVCINDSPWQYHFEEDNYKAVRSFTPSDWQAHVWGHDFIKLSCRKPLSDYAAVPQWAVANCEELFKILL